MAGPLESVAVEFIKNLDALDVDGLISVLADDVEGVEEISRQWLRGRDAVEGYMRELVTQVSEIHSEMRDVNERSWGDIGVFTSWLDQTYVFEGNQVRIYAPTTLLFRRVGSDWKMALFHSVPLPEPRLQAQRSTPSSKTRFACG